MREVFITESLPTTSEYRYQHIGGKYLLHDGRPYLQLMNAKLRALTTKDLADRSTQSTKTGSMVLWSPVQLPSDQAYVRFDSKARKTGLGDFGPYFSYPRKPWADCVSHRSFNHLSPNHSNGPERKEKAAVNHSRKQVANKPQTA